MEWKSYNGHTVTVGDLITCQDRVCMQDMAFVKGCKIEVTGPGKGFPYSPVYVWCRVLTPELSETLLDRVELSIGSIGEAIESGSIVVTKKGTGNEQAV